MQSVYASFNRDNQTINFTYPLTVSNTISASNINVIQTISTSNLTSSIASLSNLTSSIASLSNLTVPSGNLIVSTGNIGIGTLSPQYNGIDAKTKFIRANTLKADILGGNSISIVYRSFDTTCGGYNLAGGYDVCKLNYVRWYDSDIYTFNPTTSTIGLSASGTYRVTASSTHWGTGWTRLRVYSSNYDYTLVEGQISYDFGEASGGIVPLAGEFTTSTNDLTLQLQFIGTNDPSAGKAQGYYPTNALDTDINIFRTILIERISQYPYKA